MEDPCAWRAPHDLAENVWGKILFSPDTQFIGATSSDYFFFMLLILKGLKKEVTSMKSPAYMTYLTMELSGLGPL